MRLRLVMSVPDHRVAVASRATDALWPAVLAHQGEALRVVEQGCEVDRVHCGHDDRTPMFAGHRGPPETVIIPELVATSLQHPGSRQEPFCFTADGQHHGAQKHSA